MRGPWWIIGSAAVALHGVDPGPVGDVDLLIDAVDAPILFDALGIVNSAASDPPGDALFRSRWFGCWQDAPLPIEIMADLHVRAAERWESVRPVTRHAVRLNDARLFVPDPRELQAILLRFDRPKDRARAASIAVVASKRARTC